MLIAPSVPNEIRLLAEQVSGHDGSSWAFQCHAASLSVVNSGMFPGSRVARGAALGVVGQHSWVVLPAPGEYLEGELADPYDPKALVFDPTLWSYDEKVLGIWSGTNLQRHWPKGFGRMEQYDFPYFNGQSEDVIELPKEFADKLSYKARDFLIKVGALGFDGSRRVALPMRNWMILANGPVQGWPSAEIIGAMCQVPSLDVLIPIDLVGMLTDTNPGGLYLPSKETD